MGTNMGRLTSADAKPLDTAFDMARSSQLRYQHGAAIAYGNGTILGKGRNHSNAGDNTDCTSSVHAEMAALDDAIHAHSDIAWGAVTLYSVRAKRSGSRAIAFPCAACLEVAQKMGITRVVYTSDSGRPVAIYRDDDSNEWRMG